MLRTHPLYFVIAIVIAAILQFMLIRKMNRTMDVKHGEAKIHEHKDIDEH